jgi:OOP family OmpA-OmpF porin
MGEKIFTSYLYNIRQPKRCSLVILTSSKKRKGDNVLKKEFLAMLLVCGVMALGLVATNVQAIEILTAEDFVQKKVEKEYLIKTADNAIFLFDGSDSMSRPYKDSGMSRYDIAKKVFKERNSYFPDLGYNVGLYLYTPWQEVYPVQPYNREAFAAALDSLPAQPRGATMLQGALEKLGPILDGLSGKTVVFIITDGTFTDVGVASPSAPKDRPGKRPGLIAKELAEKHDLCFVAISTADDKKSQAVVDNVGSVSPCSTGIPFSKFIDRPDYYSGMLYLVKSKTEIVTVSETRAVGAKVGNIQFNLDQFELDPKNRQHLDKLGKFLQDNPESYAVLAGFTCDLGSREYNLGLSKFRVRQVSQYLENYYNIDSDRLVTLWYGKMNPIADNATEEGRRLNRRVEIAVGGL